MKQSLSRLLRPFGARNDSSSPVPAIERLEGRVTSSPLGGHPEMKQTIDAVKDALGIRAGPSRVIKTSAVDYISSFPINLHGFIKSIVFLAALGIVSPPALSNSNPDINIFYGAHGTAGDFNSQIPALDKAFNAAKDNNRKILLFLEDAVLLSDNARENFKKLFPDWNVDKILTDSKYQ